MTREYRVWTETSDLLYAGPDRDEADEAMGEAIQEHIAWNECRGCGVLTSPQHHGYSLQIVEGGNDTTGDPSVYAH